MELTLRKTLDFMKENNINRVQFTNRLILSYNFEEEEYAIWYAYMNRRGISHRNLETFIEKACAWLKVKGETNEKY